jgi:hypothetical protein
MKYLDDRYLNHDTAIPGAVAVYGNDIVEVVKHVTDHPPLVVVKYLGPDSYPPRYPPRYGPGTGPRFDPDGPVTRLIAEMLLQPDETIAHLTVLQSPSRYLTVDGVKGDMVKQRESLREQSRRILTIEAWLGAYKAGKDLVDADS